MKLVSRSGLLLVMLVPTLLLISWLMLGSRGVHSASGGPALLLPPDDPDMLPPPAPGGTRGPSALLFTPDGKRLYVAEQDENDIAVLDPNSGKPLYHLPSGGEQPTALALSADGSTMAVANTFSGSVGILDLEKRTLRTQVPLLGEPCGVVITRSGTAFVSVGQLDQIAVLDLAAGKITERLPVGHQPRSLLLTPDGSTLLCANRIGGSLSLIDVETHKEKARIPLPVTNLRGLALSPDGTRVYLTGQQPHNDIPTDKPEAIWSNVLCMVHLANGSGTLERILPLDMTGRGSADPCGVVVDANEENVYVTLSGTHEAMRVPVYFPNSPGHKADQKQFPPQRVHVGANPRAIALRPGGAELWIGNHLGNSLSVISNAVGTTAPTALQGSLRQVELGAPTPSPNRRLKGRYLFTSAHIVRGRHFSCDSCHPDGNTDGLSWKLAHVKEPPEVRNTRDLRGSLLLTAPYGWTSREEDFEVFVEDEVAGLLKTHLLQHPEVHALWDLVNETPLPPNPYRNPDGSMTPAAQRGQRLFTGQAGCVSCHASDMRGGTKRHEWIGTTPPGLKLDVPHLVGAYESAPYLHDGRAATLEEVFTRYNPNHMHGNAHTLTPEQFRDLMEYVREL
jgi:DNA-binding beta-propeller fold protein YncE/mono/diheme cytochrome c family protein